MSSINTPSTYIVTCPKCDYRETWFGEKAAFHDAQSHWHMMSHLTGEQHDATYTAKYRNEEDE